MRIVTLRARWLVAGALTVLKAKGLAVDAGWLPVRYRPMRQACVEVFVLP